MSIHTAERTVFCNHFYQRILQSGYEPVSFLVDYFQPVKVVITLLYRQSSQILAFAGGLGSSLLLQDAYTKSLSEAIQLKDHFERSMLQFHHQSQDFHEQYQSDFLKSQDDPVTIAYVQSFQHLLQYRTAENELRQQSKQDELNYLIQHLPPWLKELHVIQLNSFSYHRLKVIKIFSRELFNHVPKKDHLNLQLTINKQTLNLSKEQLAEIPDCTLV